MSEESTLPLTFDELVDEAERLFRMVGRERALDGKLLMYTSPKSPGKVHLFNFETPNHDVLPHMVRAFLHAHDADQAVLVFESTGIELKDVPEHVLRRTTNGRAGTMEEFHALLMAGQVDKARLLPYLMKQPVVQRVSLAADSLHGRRLFLLYMVEQVGDGRTFIPDEQFADGVGIYPMLLTDDSDPGLLEAMGRVGLWMSLADDIPMEHYPDLNPVTRKRDAAPPPPSWTPPGWDVEVGPDAPEQ